ncbi:MAG: AI-2E family transporter [Acidobacteria bacterium]|nr:AI-2E family transporter [Acidobacteriota bacterium]
MTETNFRKAFLLLMVGALTIGLLIVLRGFLLTILVSALMAGLVYPVYCWLAGRLGDRTYWAASITLLLTFIVIVGPLLGIVSLVVGQAASIVENVRPIVDRTINEPTHLDRMLRDLPGYDLLAPHREQIVTTAGDVVNSIGRFLMTSLGDTTRGTVSFLFHFVIALYTMFFLLLDGRGMLGAVLDHLPLHASEKALLTDRFVSVTKATIKGTIIIGVIQGTTAGLAFWAVGIPNAAFWTVVMAVLSILPLIGSALIWVPASIFLFASGAVTKAILLIAFCAFIVGSIDNVLRPRLVGHDTKMHDIAILFSTLGGIAAFGPLGFIIGPVLAGLFVTSWQIFGLAYRDELVDQTPRIVTADE